MNKTGPLTVDPSRRFLIRPGGEPFFYLGDTAWELFHALDREEGALYLKDRADKGFTVIQAVALAERDGLAKPNAYGRTPLLENAKGDYDPVLPDLEGDDSYWNHVDYLVDKAGELGLYMGLLPTWGDKFTPGLGLGPAVFTPENALEYGRFMGDRYKNRDNILWIMGGDRHLETLEHHLIVDNMAKGIKEAGDTHPMTFHPRGSSSSSLSVHNRDWLDFNMIQTGHAVEGRDVFGYLERDYAKKPVKPVLNGEPLYEDIPVGFDSKKGYFDAFDCRVAAYRSLLAGACGHTYGHNNIWSMTREGEENAFFIMSWRKAMDRPGSAHMGYVKNFFTHRNWLTMVPFQDVFIEEGEGEQRLSAARGEGWVAAYSPLGLPLWFDEAALDSLLSDGPRSARWYDPRTGEYGDSFPLVKANHEKVTWQWYEERPDRVESRRAYRADPPSCGRGNDWVILIS